MLQITAEVKNKRGIPKLFRSILYSQFRFYCEKISIYSNYENLLCNYFYMRKTKLERRKQHIYAFDIDKIQQRKLVRKAAKLFTDSSASDFWHRLI
ncbi:hypothetical protein T10_7665 [Trichinella papuae]|uniref:Uncharacterized protein n=1 Tax=Trichinella papuae TaxID=268474 RepID=A0A0V1N570_9BILA|nr:hypothetical protein T10_7665 [Trichinella papuae]